MTTLLRRRSVRPFSVGEASVLAPSFTTLLLSILLLGCGGDEPAASGNVAESPESNAPGVREIGPSQYEVTLIAFEGGFNPAEIRVPVGAEVLFRVTSTDVLHGFLIEDTPVEVEVYPGEVAEFRHTFTEVGGHTFLCHLYCGGTHDQMHGRLIVE